MTEEFPSESSLLVLPDGRLLVRNVTPELTVLLQALQPGNPDLALRATSSDPSPFPTITETDP